MSEHRLTVFLPSLAGGGAERSMATLAGALAARGAAVTLVLGRARGPLLDMVPPGVRVVDLGAASLPLALPGLIAHLRHIRPDALLSAISHANVVAALAWRLARSPARLVLSERVHLSSWFAERRDAAMWATRALMRRTYPWATHIVAVSHGVAQDLPRHVAVAAERIVAVYNPVVDEHLLLQAADPAPPAHRWLAAHDGIPVVLAAGRLIAQKGFDTLLTAFALLRAQRQARLVILGEGSLRPALLAHAAALGIADDVALQGFVANPFAAMRAAGVFVLSSRFEGLPGVLIQAMACGAPVVATDCPSGPREVLEDGRWGALVAVDDAPALAAALAAALDDPRPPDVRARAADFSVARAAAQYAALLGLP